MAEMESTEAIRILLVDDDEDDYLVTRGLLGQIRSLGSDLRWEKTYDTGDQSRNLAWLALPTLGEAWHNNHHAFPTSANHGHGRRQPDPSAAFIWALERCGLAWDVVRISPERRLARAIT